MAEKTTKVIVIGEQPKEWKSRRIKLEQSMDTAFDFVPCMDDPSQFDCIELICANYDTKGNDLIFGYDDGYRERGTLYIGKFNDGIV